MHVVLWRAIRPFSVEFPYIHSLFVGSVADLGTVCSEPSISAAIEALDEERGGLGL